MKNSLLPGQLRLCIVAHTAYGALSGGASGHIGGVDRQTSLLARWFAARGHHVSFVTWDEGQADELTIDGVQVVTVCRSDAGIPGLRFFSPRWTSLNAALKHADADLYYQNCAECVTGQIALWCRRHTRKFIYSSASDADCDAQLPLLKAHRERILYRFGIKHADRIIVQTRTQKHQLEQSFNRESVILPMACPEPEGTWTPRMPRKTDKILWVGRIDQPKRPDRFLDVAEACSDLQFDLVGPSGDSAYSRRVMERAQHLPNVTVHGRIARDKLPLFYQNAACLCCTSDIEGFPNTFLEAWSYGLPIVSMFDPDRLITEKGLGIATVDIDGLIRAIRQLLRSPDSWSAASTRVRQYYLHNYSVDRVLPKFEQLFWEILEGK